MDYRQKIKDIREDKDETQRQIAQILQTTQQQIYKYETKKQQMTVERLRKLCIYWHISADYLLDLPRDLDWPR